jgi:hypothetical protein
MEMQKKTITDKIWRKQQQQNIYNTMKIKKILHKNPNCEKIPTTH